MMMTPKEWARSLSEYFGWGEDSEQYEEMTHVLTEVQYLERIECYNIARQANSVNEAAESIIKRNFEYGTVELSDEEI